MYVHGKIILQILPKIITLLVRASLDDPASILDQFQIEGKPGSRGGESQESLVEEALMLLTLRHPSSDPQILYHGNNLKFE